MLKLIRLNAALQKQAVIVFILFTLFSCLNCGKRTPPLPPVERVTQRVTINGFQRGNAVNLSWVMPAHNAEDKSTLNVSRIDVYRLAEPLNSPLTLNESEFASQSTMIATIPINKDDFARKEFKYIDKLEFAGQAVRLRYAVRFVNNSGQKASFSNFLLIEPTAKIASAPRGLSATNSEEGIILKWDPPLSNIDNSTPANILGYNVYRATFENEAAKLLNQTPITTTSYDDNSIIYNNNYYYFVRTVSLGSSGEPVESLESNIVKITPKDTFPPMPPSAITIAAAPNNISIFFAANTEKDIAGYRIYRSTSNNLPLERWKNLTPDILEVTTFQDTDVESGVTYYYYLTAVDNADNVSKPSKIVFEKAP